MTYDDYGQVLVTCNDLFDLLYKNPELDISGFVVENPDEYNSSAKILYYSTPALKKHVRRSESIESFDHANQANWHMPRSYYDMDIAQWCLDCCTTEQQTARVLLELDLYKERNLTRLLQYLKFLVDQLRKHKIVWGVGRGSSVASYVLYLIGVHRIDSLKYDLDITEFLK